MISPDLATQIDRLQKAARNTRTARNVEQKEAARLFLVNRASALDVERARLDRTLTAGYVYLERHPDHPGRDRMEKEWLGWLRDYEAICDALRDAADVWLGTAKVAA